MREQYFELSVLGSNEQSLKELAFELGVIAIEELENGFIVRSNDDLELVELGIKSLAKALNIPISTQIQIKNNSDWISNYQNSIKPVKCGSFYIRPSWHEASKDSIDIIIDPALAFGSGHHESTSSCLELISEFCAGKKELKTALDVGCGSGILSIALAKLAFEVSSCDTESQAVESCLTNASKNIMKLICFCVGLPPGFFTSMKTALPSERRTPKRSEKPGGSPVLKYLPSCVYPLPTLQRNITAYGARAARISF